MADNISHGQSQVFTPYRALGFICDQVPLEVAVKGTVHLILTSVGKSVHTYFGSNLQLHRVSPFLPDEISSIKFIKKFIVVAAGKSVYTLDADNQVHFGTFSDHTENVIYMISVGDYVVTVDEGNIVNVWLCDEEEIKETYLNFKLDPSQFKISCCLHPATYLNKVLFGSIQGKLQLWNVKTHSLIHEFKGWEEPVVLLDQAPAVDVVAICLESGHVIMYNIKYKRKLMSFYQDFGQITCLSFRTDGQPIMSTGSTLGHISVWDLENKRPVNVMRNAHAGPIVGMKYFQRQPILVTSSTDNALKMWAFDNPDGSATLLRKLQGHSAPPNRILFYGEEGKILLSGGHDCSFRYSSVNRGLGCNEMSQGKVTTRGRILDVKSEELKLPPITCIAADFARAYDWDNVITCHLGHNAARTWSSQGKTLGKYRFKQSLKEIDIVATACEISACGNFALVGYSSGSIEKYNMQSGILRGTLGYLDEYGKHTGHSKTVRGVHSDSANYQIISTSADKTIKFWRFKDHILDFCIKCKVAIAISKLHRNSSLLAVAFDNFSIKLYDVDTKVKVRRFLGHSNIITDMTWSSDGRWIISSSIDSTIKTWDIPSARLIDCFVTDDPPTSVTFSPNGEYLASTHQRNIGIFLWANKVRYSGTYPTPLPDDYEPCNMMLPMTCLQKVQYNEEAAYEETQKENIKYVSPEQIGEWLITLSMLPDSRWCNLVDIDLIKLRNKPKESVPKPKSVPFFLPSIDGLERKVGKQKGNEREKPLSNTEYISNKLFLTGSVMRKHVENSNQTYAELMSFLKELSPSELEIEFRMLAPEMGGNLEDLIALMKAFCILLESGKNYELLQAYIGLFLNLHGDLLLKHSKLREIGQEMLERLKSRWNRCQQLLHQSSCLVKYFKSPTI